jgi:DNA mismatch endonuclease (patch repair protein)
VVFPGVRLAIFVHGCYWHRCPTCAPRDVKANADFWRAKFTANVTRDEAARARLIDAGWAVATVWEHEIRTDVLGAAERIAGVVAARRGTA